MKKLVKRSDVLCQRPNVYSIPGCNCGNADPDWSEYKDHIWCANCKIDFEPAHWGILDGPVGINACAMLGIHFDRLDLATGKIIPFEEQF